MTSVTKFTGVKGNSLWQEFPTNQYNVNYSLGLSISYGNETTRNERKEEENPVRRKIRLDFPVKHYLPAECSQAGQVDAGI